MIQYNPKDENVFLTPNQAAKILNISLATLKKFIYSGKIKTLKTPGGHHRILKNDLLGLMESDLVQELSNISKNKNNDEVIQEFLHILESRQRFCHGHAASVAKTSVKIAKDLNFSSKQTKTLRSAALLHDIGLLGITESILNKTSSLNALEYSVVKTHSLIGGDILKHFKQFQNLSSIISQHHERYDGKGYPFGLEKDKICLEARIISLAEAFDSMTAKDSYRVPLSQREALSTIEQNAGQQFDSHIVEIFSKSFKDQK